MLFNDGSEFLTNNNNRHVKRTIMKIKMIVCSALGCQPSWPACVSEQHERARDNKEAKQAKLMAQAKVSKDDALKTALANVPNGAIKEGRIGKGTW